MDYNHDEFNALAEAVDNQGGTHLPERCEGTVLKFQVGKKITGVSSCHCNNETLFVSIYEPSDAAEAKNAHQRGGGFARSCAVCDDMGEWPRYRTAVYG